MQSEDRRFLLMGAGLVGMGLAGVAAAGSLNPPPGPVTPTGKTLTDIEPRTAVQSLAGDATASFVISQPGSYYLTGNIVGASPKDGIRITASDVTIDLCGFAITGSGSGSGFGVNQSSGVRARIVNGFVSSFGSGAIRVGTTSVVSDVVASSGGIGISAGDQSRVERCTVQLAATGIQVLTDSTVAGCRVDSATTAGITAGGGSRVSQCEVNGGTSGIQLTGSAAGSPSVVRDCLVRGATTNGIDVSPPGSVVEGCTVNGAPNAIRIIGDRSRVALNHIVQCATGIFVSNGFVSLVVQNTIHGATTSPISAPTAQVGPIVSGTTFPVPTNPWSNFTG